MQVYLLQEASRGIFTPYMISNEEKIRKYIDPSHMDTQCSTCGGTVTPWVSRGIFTSCIIPISNMPATWALQSCLNLDLFHKTRSDMIRSGWELRTYGMASKCSATELHPQLWLHWSKTDICSEGIISNLEKIKNYIYHFLSYILYSGEVGIIYLIHKTKHIYTTVV